MEALSDLQALSDGLAAIRPSAAVSFSTAWVQPQVELYAQEMVGLEKAASHRRDEFASGRSCARVALAAQGAVVGALPADADGVPIWPNGWLGSLSHSRGLCVAVAASVQKFTYLGVDLEKTTRLSAAAIARVVHPAELAWVADEQARASLLFSAKEAFYKAQFPAWRCYANFHDLSLEVDDAQQTARIRSISAQFPEELRGQAEALRFRYHYFADYVVTLCWAAVT